MEFLDVIHARRSTREFSKEKMKKEEIVKLIESARLAPTAANRQNWFFLILEEDKKNKVANIMQKHLDKERKIQNSEVQPMKKYTPTSSLMGSIQVIKEAPILILALRRNDKNWFEGDYLSMGAAIENICLTATNLGLASLWLRDVIYVRDSIVKQFSLRDMDLVSAIAIGMSKEFPYERKKKSLEEIMQWG